MAGDLYNYVAKNVLDSIVKYEVAGVTKVLALPRVSTGNFNRQPELTRLTTSNCQAVTVTAKRVETEIDPVCALTFGSLGLPLLSLSQDRQWATVASTTDGEYYRSDLDVPADGVIPAVTSGTLGYDITADAVSYASYIDANGLSTPLVQGTYAGFNAASDPLKFAVGANGAMKFGEDLWGKSVSISVTQTLTNVHELSNVPYTNLSLKVRAALVNLYVYEWLFPSVSIDTAGERSFSAAETQVNFFVNGNYNVRVVGKLAPC